MMKPSGIGGQAVIEGVMMRNKSKYALAVRKPDGDIEVTKDVFLGISDKIPIFRLPFLRGIAALFDSLSIGMKTLSYSAEYYEEEEKNAEELRKIKKISEKARKKSDIDKLQADKKEEEDVKPDEIAGESDEEEIVVREWKDPSEQQMAEVKAKNRPDSRKKSDVTVKEGFKREKNSTSKKDALITAFITVLSFVLVIILFVMVPFILAELFGNKINSYGIRSVIEGLIRLVIFVAYIKAISMMKDIKRVFMYHGAEHKVINCIEKGHELDVRNARRQSRLHKRCGTSFLLFVIFVSIIVFVFIQVDIIWLRMLLRIVLVPFIAGIAYELIRLAGRSNNIIVNIISVPGFLLQGLTTKEPDDSMLEVAIASVNAVFDWEKYQEKERRYDYRRKKYKVQDMKKSAEEDVKPDVQDATERKRTVRDNMKSAIMADEKEIENAAAAAAGNMNTSDVDVPDNNGDTEKEDSKSDSGVFEILTKKPEEPEEKETETGDKDDKETSGNRATEEKEETADDRPEVSAVTFKKGSEEVTIDPIDDIDNPGDVNSFGEEETDEILKALDKFFVMDKKDEE